MQASMTIPQMAVTVGAVVLATVSTRFLPYLLFPEGRKVPKFILYLGKVLGPAVFGLLVVYCLRNVNFFTGTPGVRRGCGFISVEKEHDPADGRRNRGLHDPCPDHLLQFRACWGITRKATACRQFCGLSPQHAAKRRRR